MQAVAKLEPVGPAVGCAQGVRFSPDRLATQRSLPVRQQQQFWIEEVLNLASKKLGVLPSAFCRGTLPCCALCFSTCSPCAAEALTGLQLALQGPSHEGDRCFRPSASWGVHPPAQQARDNGGETRF